LRHAVIQRVEKEASAAGRAAIRKARKEAIKAHDATRKVVGT
jgi:hypothetical protein